MFEHGVYSQEEPTAVIGIVQTATALPFVVGSAPIHTVPGVENVNGIVKLSSWQDVLDQFGYVHDFQRYSLIEFAYSWFRIFGFAPLLAVNVFDPSALTGTATYTAATLVNGVASLQVAGAMVQAITSDGTGTTVYVEGIDYSLAYDEDGYPIVTRLSGSAISSPSSTIYFKYLVISAAKCGVSASAVVNGLGMIDAAYAQFGDIPSLIAVPGFSENPTVGAAMVARTQYGGGRFAYALTDVDTSSAGADTVTEVANWKSTNGYTDPDQEVLWPLARIGSDTFHLSTLMAGALAAVDAANGNIPYVSGSNYSLPATGAVNAAGTAVWLNDEQANDSLNANGVTTLLNLGARGWVLWGNYSGAYPGDTDPKDTWRSYRRMLIWLKNTVHETLLQKVDQPGNTRQIESIINSLNIWLNGLAAQGALIGKATVEFRQEDNPITSLVNGQYTIKITILPPTPMQSIVVEWQIDVSQFSALFPTA